MDTIGQFIDGGEPAGNFGPSVNVWSEMAVRVVVLRVMQHYGLTNHSSRIATPAYFETPRGTALPVGTETGSKTAIG